MVQWRMEVEPCDKDDQVIHNGSLIASLMTLPPRAPRWSVSSYSSPTVGPTLPGARLSLTKPPDLQGLQGEHQPVCAGGGGAGEPRPDQQCLLPHQAHVSSWSRSSAPSLPREGPPDGATPSYKVNLVSREELLAHRWGSFSSYWTRDLHSKVFFQCFCLILKLILWKRNIHPC